MASDLTVTSAYLEILEHERAELIAAMAPAVDAALIDSAHRRSARLSVRLDASPLQAATAAAVDRGAAPDPIPAAGASSGAGWAQVLKLEGLPTQEIAAAEYRGVRAAQAQEERLARQFFASPVATLAELQRLIVAGLVADEHLGALRTTSRAVNDGAQGRAIFLAPDPQRLPGLLDGLDRWVRQAANRHAPLAIAGVVHARILQWEPYEAGNGRVARAASRVALRATGGDPWGLAVPERAYLRASLTYVSEIAATIRRGTDLRPWNERTGEAVIASLEATARRLGVVPRSLSARGVHECAQLAPGDTITVVEFATAIGSERSLAMAQLNRLCWAGLLRRDAGTHGLRYVRLAESGVR